MKNRNLIPLARAVRDGVTREGAPGELYSAERDTADVRPDWMRIHALRRAEGDAVLHAIDRGAHALRLVDDFESDETWLWPVESTSPWPDEDD